MWTSLLIATGLARTYPTPVVVDDEDDLTNLYEDGLLSADELAVLLELLYNPLNLNTATVGELYDLPGVSLRDASFIVAERRREPFSTVEDLSVVLPPETYVQVLPFIEAGPQAPSKGTLTTLNVRVGTRKDFAGVDPLSGVDHANRSHTTEQLGYGGVPASRVVLQTRYSQEWKAGVALAAQQGIQRMEYDPGGRDLYASYGMGVELGRYYVTHQRERFGVIAGTYSAGFGQGLTFDATDRTQPQGWYRDVSMSTSTDYDRFRFPNKLMGTALRVELPAAVGSYDLDATIFVSSSRHDIYQYDWVVTGGEPVDSLVDPSSPRVYIVEDGKPTRASYLNLPNAWRESLVGGNVTLSNGLSQVGLTSYVGSWSAATIAGVENDREFMLNNGYPEEKVYGAVGLNGALHLGPTDLMGEFATTFSGGQGGLVRFLVYPLDGEVELTLRRYGVGFDNPHARGQAAPDEYLGMRDRAEQGVRVKAETPINAWASTRFTVDLWEDLSVREIAPVEAPVWNGLYYGRVRLTPVKMLRVDVYGQLTDRNISAPSQWGWTKEQRLENRSEVYGGSWDDFYSDDTEFLVAEDISEAPEANEGTLRSGTRSFYGAQLQVEPLHWLRLSAQYQRMYEDVGVLYPGAAMGWTDSDAGCAYWYQIGQYAWFKARIVPIEGTTLNLRVRYRDEDIVSSLGERFTDTYLQVDQRVGGRVTLSARGTLGWELPDAESELTWYCDTLDTQALDGTCVVDLEPPNPGEEARMYGILWIGARARF